MSVRIERLTIGQSATLRLIGRLRGNHLETLKLEISGSAGDTVLDLQQVTLVDVDVVRFLNRCEQAGIKVTNASPFIREWMRREHSEED